MRKNDIRFNGKAATIEHHSARGKITRNSGNFTRGSQLISHEIMMTWAGIRIPLLIWLFTFVPAITITMSIMMKDHETGLVLMRLYSSVWSMMDLDPGK
ncbi:MAG: hypothetical protein HC843_13700 [Sphingomonadales bacterium]|nr:hypothetical protein [Sphingomonadales bacterium]